MLLRRGFQCIYAGRARALEPPAAGARCALPWGLSCSALSSLLRGDVYDGGGVKEFRGVGELDSGQTEWARRGFFVASPSQPK